MNFKEWMTHRPTPEELQGYLAAAIKNRQDADAQIAFFKVLISLAGSGGENSNTQVAAPPPAPELADPSPEPPAPKRRGRKKKCFGDVLETNEPKCEDCAWRDECYAEAAKED